MTDKEKEFFAKAQGYAGTPEYFADKNAERKPFNFSWQRVLIMLALFFIGLWLYMHFKDTTVIIINK